MPARTASSKSASTTPSVALKTSKHSSLLATDCANAASPPAPALTTNFPASARSARSGLSTTLPRDGGVALSWGSSVQAVVDEIPDDASHENIEVLPLVGGLSIVDSARDGNVLVRLLATKLGAQHRRLYAPAVVESLESREAFLREPSITGVLNASRRAKIAIVGVGNVGKGASSAIIESMNLSRTERSEFAASGAVGDCCTRFFDHEGKLVESVVNDRVIAIDLDELGSIPTVVGVAAGAHKLEGTHAALTGGLFDVLVVDSDLALALLNQR